MKGKSATCIIWHICLCACLSLLLLSVRLDPRAEAWSVSGHQIIASRACRLFPGPWGDFFRHYESILNDTVLYPDTFYRDRDPAELSRHFIDLEIWSKDWPETGTLPSAIESYARDMSEAVKAGDWNRVLLDAGRLSHYVSDICQPYHSTVYYDPKTKNGSNIHVMLDSAIVTYLSETHLTSSVRPVKIANLTDYAFCLARESYSFLAEINSTLIDQDCPWSPRLTMIIENRTNTAIAATVNVWYTTVTMSNANPPDLSAKNTLRIVEKSGRQTIDLLRNNYLEFVVADALGVRTPCEVTAEISGTNLEIESYQDVENPWIRYRAVLSESKIRSMVGILEVRITATREGYAPGELVFSMKTPQSSTDQLNCIVLVSVTSVVIMIVCCELLVRERRKQRMEQDS